MFAAKKLNNELITLTEEDEKRIHELDNLINEMTTQRFNLLNPIDEEMEKILKGKISDKINVRCRFYKKEKQCGILLTGCSFQSAQKKFSTLITWDRLSLDENIVDRGDGEVLIQFEFKLRDKILQKLNAINSLDIEPEQLSYTVSCESMK